MSWRSLHVEHLVSSELAFGGGLGGRRLNARLNGGSFVARCTCVIFALARGSVKLFKSCWLSATQLQCLETIVALNVLLVRLPGSGTL